MMVFNESPSIFLPNFFERFSAISASAGTTTRIVGRNIAISRNISLLLRQMYRVEPVYSAVIRLRIKPNTCDSGSMSR